MSDNLLNDLKAFESTQEGRKTPHIQGFKEDLNIKFEDRGPFLRQTPDSGPLLCQRPDSGPFLCQTPDSGPFLCQTPDSGPSLCQTPDSGPFLYQRPDSGPFLYQRPDSGPFLPSFLFSDEESILDVSNTAISSGLY